MKNLAVVSLTLIALFSCSDPEIKDELTGRWEFNSIDASNSKSVIKASFTINRDYSIKDPAVTIDGNYISGFTGACIEPVSGDKIGKIVFNNQDYTITFYNADKLIYNPAWTIDSVKVEGASVSKYYWQALKAAN